jgi:ankyrin repeat protein
MKASMVCKSWRNHILSSSFQVTYLKNAEIKYSRLNPSDLVHNNQLAQLASTIKNVRTLAKNNNLSLERLKNCVNSEEFPSPFNAEKFLTPEFKSRVEYESESFQFWVNTHEPNPQYDINARSGFGTTPLMETAEEGDWRKCQMLIKNGAKVHVKDTYKGTPLSQAVYSGSLKTVKVLVEAGAKIHWQKKNNDNEITYAIFMKHYKIALYLVNQVDSTEAVSDMLFDLLYARQDKLLIRLIEKGSKINSVRNGETLLHAACELNKLKIMKFLIDRGADVNSKSLYGGTPLINAVRNEKVKAAKLLIENGADPQLKDFRWKTALDYAKKHLPDEVELIQLLHPKRRRSAK